MHIEDVHENRQPGALCLELTETVFVEDIAQMAAAIRRAAQDGDVVLTMGAGSISGVAAQLT